MTEIRQDLERLFGNIEPEIEADRECSERSRRIARLPFAWIDKQGYHHFRSAGGRVSVLAGLNGITIFIRNPENVKILRAETIRSSECCIAEMHLEE